MVSIGDQERSLIEQLTEMKNDFVRAYAEEVSTRQKCIPVWTHEFADCVSINQVHMRTLIRYFKDGNILGNTQEATNEIQKILSDLESNNSQMRVYLHDLNSYAQTGSIAIAADVSMKTIDLSKLVESVVRMVEQTYPRVGPSIIIDADEPGRIIYSDKHRITQIVSNLVRNAIRYASPSDIRVIVRFDVVDEVDYFVLVVEDDGPGIPPEDQERIFLRNEQSRPQDGDQKIGSGLGLYIVRELISKLSGTMELQSELGKGSRFVVRLPAG